MPRNKYGLSAEVTATVRATLANEYWYGDGPPKWLELRGTPWERPCETAADARRRRETAARKLWRASSEFPGAANLAQRLESCRRKERCLSGACPECSRALQRSLITQTPSRALQREDE
jgi:hypothetical protein